MSSPIGSRRSRPRGEAGQITLLALVYTLIAFCLVAVVVDVTAVQLARTQLLDAADAAALDAADALDPTGVYAGGVPGESVPVTDDGVRRQAERYLQTYTVPSRLDRITLGEATGTQDGQSATVQLVGRVRLPIAAAAVASLGDPITITVQSTARAELLVP